MLNIIKNLIDLKTPYKVSIIFIVDIFLLFISLILSISLRLDEVYIPNTQFFIIYIFNIIIFLLLSFQLKFHKTLYRYFSISEILKYLQFSLFYSLIFFFLIIIFKPLYFPRSVPLINFFIFSILIISSRYLISYLVSNFSKKDKIKNLHSMRSIAIYGAGIMGSLLLNSLKKEFKLHDVVFIDDDPNKFNRYLEGVKIFKFSELKRLIELKKIDTIIISITNLSHIKSDITIKLANENNIKILLSPSLLDEKVPSSLIDLTDFKNEFFVKSKIKNNFTVFNKDIFIEDNILITGGGGSIGSELSRQISYLNFNKLIIADISEFNLFKIKEDLNELFSSNISKTDKFIFVLLDLKDPNGIYDIFQKFNPTLVYHAAAYKHVPIVENNIKMGIKNNFIGTANLIDISIEYNVRKFLFVSTDKAVNPINLMGITKRLCELYVKKVSSNSSTNSSIVRFGNVVGSSGSVLPLFLNQIKNGGPVTITHEEVTRYFMTIPDAVSLIIYSSFISNGGEIYVLNMGKPKKILDLANNLIAKTEIITNGSYKSSDIKIQIIGLRKGEKLHEEIYNDEIIPTKENSDILISSDTKNEDEDIMMLLESIKSNIDNFATNEIIDEINKFFKII